MAGAAAGANATAAAAVAEATCCLREFNQPSRALTANAAVQMPKGLAASACTSGFGTSTLLRFAGRDEAL
eukprot:CAMPEP_0171101774 /NCGR_PEP_ID=MMETSP0766_2-20121228/55954_1 /TAXON_ID=439317 /ORGANISM="Gambierdiscus australes, Strain CAWD 149" /LENGTH=69 /DNA_ID=CAMNT_0011561909 /DNA_START=33 /DNA_END=242 /DNA_ORIENTATION=-